MYICIGSVGNVVFRLVCKRLRLVSIDDILMDDGGIYDEIFDGVFGVVGRLILLWGFGWFVVMRVILVMLKVWSRFWGLSMIFFCLRSVDILMMVIELSFRW